MRHWSFEVGKTIHQKASFNNTVHSIIEPYFRYCNTIWGQCQNLLLNKLQTLQNKAARIVVGKSYKEADHTKLLQELGWLNVRKLI